MLRAEETNDKAKQWETTTTISRIPSLKTEFVPSYLDEARLLIGTIKKSKRPSINTSVP